MKQRIQIGFLVVLLAVLGYYLYQRIGMRMGGTPSSLLTEFQTEEDWMLHTILRDIAGAAAYAQGVPPDDVKLSVHRTPTGPMSLPLVTVLELRIGDTIAIENRVFTLDRSFWNPANYEQLAAELLGPANPTGAGLGGIALLQRLLDPRPSVLVEENERISGRLAADIRDAEAHEEAAVLLGVLGLKEAAFSFDDKRFLLLRMTSHLALARALRAGQPLSTVGQIGEATLLTLSGRQAELFERLPTIRDGGDALVVESWKSALYMHVTDDWRRKSPADPLLVQLMRFRALAASLGPSTALERMPQGGESELADWGRILNWLSAGSVETGFVVEEQVDRELAEIQEVWLTRGQGPLSLDRLGEVLNEQPGGLVGEEGPQVIDWGHWASFYQRHLCGALAARGHLLRHTYGVSDAAALFSETASAAFADIDLVPIVQVSHSRYPGARVEDTVGMDESIALTRRHPELVNPTTWRFLEDTARYMMRKRGMPSSSSWLSTNVLLTGILDSTADRFQILARSLDQKSAVETMKAIAPLHANVLDVAVERMDRSQRGENMFHELYEAYGARLDFDRHAIKDLMELTSDNDEWLELSERMCRIDANECAGLGWAYAEAGRDDEAVTAFERLVKEGPSHVHACNNSNWLVNYYYDHGRRRDAIRVADQAEDVFCSWGARTKAHLLERMGRPTQAEGLYVAEAERYESDGPVAYPLLGFYYRMARVQNDSNYEARLADMLSKVFPDGLEPLPDEMDSVPPTGGVLIDGTSRYLDEAGLRGGDVIVGLDGWRVRTLEQYDAIREFRALPSSARDMRVRVWRQTQYLNLTPELFSRAFRVTVRTFGTPGPSYVYR